MDALNLEPVSQCKNNHRLTNLCQAGFFACACQGEDTYLLSERVAKKKAAQLAMSDEVKLANTVPYHSQSWIDRLRADGQIRP